MAVLLLEDRLEALSLIASQHNYKEKDIDVLVAILSLRRDPHVAYVNLISPATSNRDYVCRLKSEMTEEQIDKMLKGRRLEWGMHDGKPFYDFPTDDQLYNNFTLRFLQPWDSITG